MNSTRTRSSLRLRIVLVAAALLAGLAAPSGAGAQTDPNLERGIAGGKAYSAGDLDTVNLFNGNLSLTIPLGGAYPVDGGLAYGLSLSYNSNVWDFQTVYRNNNPYTQAQPAKHSNAGLGFQVSLGKILPPGTEGSSSWRYLSEDGGEHVFFTTAHIGESSTGGVFYSRDGSHLRLKELAYGPQGAAITAEVELPDGTIRRFTRSKETDPFRIVQIRDRFGNAVDVTYPTANQWAISDSHRTHYVNFTTRTNGDVVVSTVDLAAFGGTRAVYTFAYSDTTIDRSCLDDDPVALGGTPATAAVTLLTSVTLPANGGAFTFGPYNTTCSDGSTTIPNLPGTLGKLILPTLGQIEWTYQNYTFPTRGGGCGQGGPGISISQVAGVKTKRLLDPAGTCKTWDGVGCQSTYAPSGSAANPYRQTAVTSPTGDQTIHYFTHSIALSTSTWNGWQYGLPIHPTTQDGSGRYLSHEVYDGANKVRSVYRRYEHDRLPSSTCFPNQWYDTNRRVASEKTVFHDDGDRYAEVTHSEYDGHGNYRRSITSGSFDAGNVRETFTHFNPDRKIYLIDPATNGPGGGHNYVAWGSTLPWILGTFTETVQTEGAVTARQDLCFEAATGFLLRERVLKTGTAPGASDVVKLYTRSAAGNLVREEWFGGDVQALGTGALCSLSLPANRYRVDHGYSKGVRSSSRWYDAGGGALTFWNLQLTIDANSALPSQSFDVSGIRTDLTFDALGRPTWEKPESGHGAWTQHQWAKATSASALATVTVTARPNGSTTGLLAQSKLTFDGFGRVWRDQVLGADGQWSSVDTVHNMVGRMRSVSERELGWPANLNIFKGWDAFGRPTTLQPADGTAHNVTFVYKGAREVHRTVKVWDGTAEVARTTRQRYDRQGRLYQVVEPSGTSGADVTTTYGYDVGGRLTSVSQSSGGTTQTRTFTHDNRGFLTQEKHPEKGGAGNGWIYYHSYDPLGNPGRRLDGPSDLTYTYDRASRVTQVRETGGAARVMKAFTYGTANGTGDRRLGRLQTADRYNYISVGTTPFTLQIREIYVYGGPGGRATSRNTENRINGSATPSDVFTQGWAYNDLGDVTTLTYPRCTLSNCNGPALNSRTVTHTYTRGLLTAVPGYATSISYHPNGMVDQVAHANGVTWTQALDPQAKRRPASYATAGASVNWTSGTYTWDGAGNVKSIGASAFSYDGVSRLLSGHAPTLENGASATGLKSQSATYDAFGNLLSLTTNGSLVSLPTTASTNRLTAASYDAAGNVTAWNGNTFTWDSVGMPTRTYLSSLEYDHVYTADDERILTYQPNVGYRWTLRDLDGKVLRDFRMALGNWAVERDYIYREGQLIAAVQPSGEVYHLHADHLGSPRLITGNGGAKKAFHSYYPFGAEATTISQDTERMKFTGHDRDLGAPGSAADDLDYMHARMYLPQLGRFLAFDPIGGNPRNPQSWNRYAYVLNRPMTHVDPTGMLGASMAGYMAAQRALSRITFFDSITVTGSAYDLSAFYRFFYGAPPGAGGGEGLSTGFGLLNVERAQHFYRGNFERYAVEGNYFLAFVNFAVDELFVPDSQGELGVELAMAVIPGPLDNAAFAGLKGAKAATEVTVEVAERASRGADGAVSRHLIERVGGQTTSVTHQVVRDGRVIHQHQTHIGRHGTRREFPEEWLSHKTVP